MAEPKNEIVKAIYHVSALFFLLVQFSALIVEIAYHSGVALAIVIASMIPALITGHASNTYSKEI